MDAYGPGTYGDQVADVYDEWHGDLPDTQACVERLAKLAGPGPALELAIGTGRVALPLAAAGVEVHGIDASERMVERLRAKPGGRDIPVTMGDFAEVAVEGSYRLVFLVYNTLFMLLSQDAQVACFANVAARLAPGGVFVVEAFVPDLGRFRRGQAVSVGQLGTEKVRLDLAVHDPVAQRIDSQIVLVWPEGMRLQPTFLRYAWPAELDLMARLAGLRLRDRWAGWRREPFTASAEKHVSVYERSP
ncbi:MAG TPA: methyltransferase domain-containing protein [Actinomycetes bacterium]|jgi:SAM-dependent methyltransferase|nr:methyltransferase domain-containing protein [Actinomycetes bacterium]